MHHAFRSEAVYWQKLSAPTHKAFKANSKENLKSLRNQFSCSFTWTHVYPACAEERSGRDTVILLTQVYD